MKAVWYDRNGGIEVLRVGELPTPTPGPGEVLVKLSASGVNPSDWKTRLGRSRPMGFPRQVPHSDGAGVVAAVGPGVPSQRIGEKVWIYNGAWRRPMGTAAEFIAIGSEFAPKLPEGLDFAQGACLGIPGMTAHRAVFADGSVAGKTVLVAGGAGVVGHYAVQLARWAGATVIATVSSPEKAAHAKAAGAHETVDYKKGDPADQIMTLTRGRGVDRIVEVEYGNNMELDLKVAAEGATIAYYGSVTGTTQIPFMASAAKNVVFRAILVYTMGRTAMDQAIADLDAWSRTGGPQFAVAHRYPLAAAAQAHATVEAGAKIGHVVLDID